MIYICDEFEIKRPTVHKRQEDGKRCVYEIELTEPNRRKVSKSNISYAKNITELNKEYERIYRQGWNDAIEHIQRFLDRTSKTKNYTVESMISDYTTLKNKPQIVGVALKNTEETISRADMLDAIGHGTTYTTDELQKIIKGLPTVNLNSERSNL